MAARGVAWLITWEGTSPPERLAAILPWRTNEKAVAAIVESLYALRGASVEELAAYARKPTSNPYPVTEDGHGFVCGHNPYLYARLVDKVEVATDAATAVQTISWVERPRYQLVKEREFGAPHTDIAVPARADQIRRPKPTRLWRAGP